MNMAILNRWNDEFERLLFPVQKQSQGDRGGGDKNTEEKGQEKGSKE